MTGAALPPQRQVSVAARGRAQALPSRRIFVGFIDRFASQEDRLSLWLEGIVLAADLSKATLMLDDSTGLALVDFSRVEHLDALERSRLTSGVHVMVIGRASRRSTSNGMIQFHARHLLIHNDVDRETFAILQTLHLGLGPDSSMYMSV
eukprot:CAMPEP_0177668148 /NCGR_PEP_ID=MMETSP0447-20121125/22575_1 /TAXON_ID=0 /ORGANISM="Stygamoeba regulata, Strain BSH-02190019" /LENGTH=148 /DNA_ID=CAMNT_0019174573 /DNA_START=108 /DNA_END=553 /DNA_ORIENTATION=+